MLLRLILRLCSTLVKHKVLNGNLLWHQKYFVNMPQSFILDLTFSHLLPCRILDNLCIFFLVILAVSLLRHLVVVVVLPLLLLLLILVDIMMAVFAWGIHCIMLLFFFIFNGSLWDHLSILLLHLLLLKLNLSSGIILGCQQIMILAI